jgi:hypothetical protein
MAKSLRTAKRGQYGVGLAVGIVAMFIVLILSVLIYSKFAAHIDQSGMTADENATVDDIKDYSLTGIGLLGLGILVAAGFGIVKMIHG